MAFELTSPIGAFENSPAIYRREKSDKAFFVPSGRLKQGNQASLQDAMDFSHASRALKCPAIFKCPYRTLKALNRTVRESFELKYTKSQIRGQNRHAWRRDKSRLYMKPAISFIKICSIKLAHMVGRDVLGTPKKGNGTFGGLGDPVVPWSEFLSCLKVLVRLPWRLSSFVFFVSLCEKKNKDFVCAGKNFCSFVSLGRGEELNF